MNWSELSSEKIRNGKDAKGRRYLEAFAVSFEKKMNRPLCLSCSSKLGSEIKLFLNSGKMSTTKSKYVLKSKYNGVKLGFGSDVYLTSSNITDELAERFAKEHPKGLGLFDKYPSPKKAAVKKETVKKPVEKVQKTPTKTQKRKATRKK